MPYRQIHEQGDKVENMHTFNCGNQQNNEVIGRFNFGREYFFSE